MKETKLAGFSFNEKYVSQALTEIKQASPKVKFIGNASGGFQLVEYIGERSDIINEIKNGNLIFVRHFATYEYEEDFSGNLSESLSENLSENLSEPLSEELLEKIESKVSQNTELGTFSIQFSGKVIQEIREKLEDYLLKKGLKLEIKYPEKIVTVLNYEDKLLYGVATPVENLSRWANGMAHYKQEDWEVSRSMYKLIEAFETFDVVPMGGMKALDLGASPGGWTSVLLRRGMRVTSVDTGDMNPGLSSYKTMEYIKANAAEIELGEKSYDMLLSDMSWNPMQAAKTVARAAKWLKTDGIAIVTVKLLNDKITKTINEVKKVYSDTFEVLGCKQLFHNREEVTLYMKRK